MIRPVARTLGSLAMLALLATTVAFAGGLGRREVASWETAGQLAAPRAHATVVALPSGEVLVVGGLDVDDPHIVLTTSELYDPLRKRSTVLPDRLPGRVNQTATTLPNGDVFVVGGSEWRDGDWAASEEVQEFVVASRRWVRRRPVTEARSDHGAVALADGRILVTGGNDGAHMKRSTEIYDPVSDTWKHGAPMPGARTQFSIARLPDGRVLVAGGLDQTAKPSATSVIYDPRSDAWTAGPSLLVPRVLQTTVVLPGGDVLLIGGQEYAAGTAERYDVASGTWILAGELRQPRELAQATALRDGRVVVSGGLPPSRDRSGFKPLKTTEVWDPASAAWSPAMDTPTARALGMLVATHDGIFRVGGLLEDERAPLGVERLGWTLR